MGGRSKQAFLQRRHTNGPIAQEKLLNIIINEMQIKMTLVGMAIIKQSTNYKCYRGCG